jgi:predicted hotdog family 3-hydroxylacyl-ACP dehydratase
MIWEDAVPENKLPAVEDLIPHRQRMKLIDDLVHVDVDQGSLLAVTRVKEDWPMCRAGRVDAVVLVEVVAQAVACRHGFVKRADGDPRNMGFLVGVKSARLHEGSLSVGTQLQVQAIHLYGVDEYHAYSGTVSTDFGVICEAVVQVLSPDPKTLEDLLSGQDS